MVQQHQLAKTSPQGNPASLHPRRNITINPDCNIDSRLPEGDVMHEPDPAQRRDRDDPEDAGNPEPVQGLRREASAAATMIYLLYRSPLVS